MTPRIVKRSVEAILATGRDQLVRLVGFGCPDGHELVARYAFGLAASREARRAQLHLVSCARCGTMYERLDGWRERVAALLPVPPAVEAHADIAERVVQAGADALSSGQPPAPAGLRRHLADAVAHAREQATAAYYRSVDPTPLAGARPGAVAAVVASCLAVGGGTTYYCVEQGADPFAALAGLTRSQEREPKPKPQRARARAAQTPAPPAATPTVTARRRRRRRRRRRPAAGSTPQATPTPTPAPPPPAPQDEYEPTAPVANSGATSGQAASSQPREPAPGARRRARGVRRTVTTDSREETSMHRAPAIRVIATAGALSVLNALLLASAASAGQFTVASCQADRAGFSTTAFNDFATRGMTIRRACNPEGPGIRGLVTANATQRGTRAARLGRPGRHLGADRHALHDLPVGGLGAPHRLPLCAAALRRGTGHQAGPDQERPRQPALPAPGHVRRPPGTGRAPST